MVKPVVAIIKTMGKCTNMGWGCRRSKGTV